MGENKPMDLHACYFNNGFWIGIGEARPIFGEGYALCPFGLE
jgi:hypothetical protein